MIQQKWLCAFLLAVFMGGTLLVAHMCSSDRKTKEMGFVIDTSQGPLGEKREYKSLKLDNELEVLLISSPEFNKSAAAMDVALGSLEDPEDSLGMAHFLEHLLFLGTEKYPDVEDYNRYLKSYQGYSNAYTSDENTNYYFEVDHEGFTGSLDRFAQFFVSPLFNEVYVDRELRAVHSEHQKNLEDDNWRARMVQHTLYAPGHPRRKFSTGDEKTLAEVSRESLIAFYERYYSANQMKLVLLSKQSLADMEELVREFFAGVPNHHRDELRYPETMYDPAELPRLVEIESIKNLKKLDLVFPSPNADLYWESKPHHLLTHLIGHEGQGSLLSLLKALDLATGLSAWHESSSFGGHFHFAISLTDKGLAKREKVMDLFFSYVNLLNRDGLQRYLYDERKTMADIDYVFRDHREGGDLASHLASRMHLHGPLEVERNDALFFRYDPDEFNSFLKFINPQTLTAYVLSQNVATDKIEPYYGTKYRVQKLGSDLVAYWQNQVVHQSLHLPGKSEFIPRDFRWQGTKKAEEPQLLVDQDIGRVWFKGDDRYEQPKAYLRLNLLTPDVNQDSNQKVLSSLYLLALGETLNEWKYDVSMAGLHFYVLRNDQGLILEFGGYSEKLSDLVKAVFARLKTIEITEEQFASLKEELKRSIQNASLDAAYRQLVYQLKYLSVRELIHRRDIYSPEQNVDLISSVSLDDVKAYVQNQLFAHIAIEGAVYGSIEGGELKKMIIEGLASLAADSLPKDKRPRSLTIKYPTGQATAAVMHGDTNNNCWGQLLQFGERDPKLNAAIRVGHAFLQNKFYSTLRTEQQLGYIVHSALNYHEKMLGLLFLVQSSDYSAVDIARRVDDWKQAVLEELRGLDDKTFATYRDAVVRELREEDKTMQESLETLFFEGVIMDGQHGYKDRIAQAAETMSHDEVVSVFDRAFSEPRALSVYLYHQDSIKPLASETQLHRDDELSFKQDGAVF